MFERVVMDGAVSASSGNFEFVFGFCVFMVALLTCAFWEVMSQEEKEKAQKSEETQM